MKAKWLTLLITVILATWALSGVAIVKWIAPESPGEFGDMFGAINALFSGLALAGVIIAILLQRSELRLQREELSLTRQELRRSAEAAADSAKTFKEQAVIAERAAELQAINLVIESIDKEMDAEIRNWERAASALPFGAISPPDQALLKGKRRALLVRIEAILKKASSSG
jgi:hypothetical protein